LGIRGVGGRMYVLETGWEDGEFVDIVCMVTSGRWWMFIEGSGDARYVYRVIETIVYFSFKK
jgi:hypothetical protein